MPSASACSNPLQNRKFSNEIWSEVPPIMKVPNFPGKNPRKLKYIYISRLVPWRVILLV